MDGPKPKAKAVTGEKRMRSNGRKKVVIWLDATEAPLIQAAADRVGARLATWVRQQAFHAAQKSEDAARLTRR